MFAYGLCVFFLLLSTETVVCLQCDDYLGNPVEEGHEYTPKGDPCTTCTCERGFPVTCKSVMCSPPDCVQWEQEEGECCLFHCIEPPDHGGGSMDDNGTFVPDDGSFGLDGDMAHLGLRLVASTVTSFLILALLLYMVHRLRQRRMLIAMRRFHAERAEEEQVGYMSTLDNLEIEFPPYEDPPPPYSPPKPPEMPMGEAPPPYMEREDGTGTISSRHQLIPYGNDERDVGGVNTLLSSSNNHHHSNSNNGIVNNGGVLENGVVLGNNGIVMRGTVTDSPLHQNQSSDTNNPSNCDNPSSGTIRSNHSNGTVRSNGDIVRSQSGNERSNNSLGHNNRNAGTSSSSRGNSNGRNRSHSRNNSSSRTNNSNSSRNDLNNMNRSSRSIGQNTGLNISEEQDRGASHSQRELSSRETQRELSREAQRELASRETAASPAYTIVRMHNNSPRTSLYHQNRTEGDGVVDSSPRYNASMSSSGGADAASGSASRNLFIKRSNSIEIKCGSSSPRISFYLEEDSSRSSIDFDAGTEVRRPHVLADRMTQSLHEPSTSSAAPVQRERGARGGGSAQIIPSASQASLNSETGEPRDQEDVSHAGIQPYAIGNDVSHYPGPSNPRVSPRVQGGGASGGQIGVSRSGSKRSSGKDDAGGMRRNRTPTRQNSRTRDEPMEISTSSSSSSSPSSVDVDDRRHHHEHHHRPRRVIYRDPDFDFDDSSSSSPNRDNVMTRSTPGKIETSKSEPHPKNSESGIPEGDDGGATQVSPETRERIRRRESPETFRRLSQAWDAAAKYKEYGFIDGAGKDGAEGEVIKIEMEKLRSLSKERQKRSKSKERRSKSRERGGTGGSGEPQQPQQQRTCHHHQHHRRRRSTHRSKSDERKSRQHRSGSGGDRPMPQPLTSSNDQRATAIDPDPAATAAAGGGGGDGESSNVTRRKKRHSRHSRHSGDFDDDNPPQKSSSHKSPSRTKKRRSTAGGGDNTVDSTPGVCQSTQVDNSPHKTTAASSSSPIPNTSCAADMTSETGQVEGGALENHYAAVRS